MPETPIWGEVTAHHYRSDTRIVRIDRRVESKRVDEFVNMSDGELR
jgi:hypothetical protein